MPELDSQLPEWARAPVVITHARSPTGMMGRPAMALEIVRVRPGPNAAAWLIGLTRGLQSGDPLAPVTVVVPSHHAGLHLRRRLAASGFANVRFSVLSQIAEALGAGPLAAGGRSPLTAVVRAALFRRAIRSAGGRLAQNAEQAGLVDLVAALAAELRRRDDRATDIGTIRAGGTPTSCEALDVIAAYERERAERRLYDEVDVLEAAAAAVDRGTPTLLREAGTFVIHLPRQLDAPSTLLVRSLAEHAEVIVALAAYDGFEESVEATRLGATVATSEIAHTPPATPVAVIAPDPIEEVRSAVRGVLAAMESESVPLYRNAIVYRDEESYGVALRDTLRAAGVTPVALGGRPLSDSVAGRGLIGLIRLRDQDFARSAVLAWLSGLPHHQGLLRSQARWDQLSRAARVVRGAEMWRTRLNQFANACQGRLAHLDPDADDHDMRRAAIEADINDAHRIVEQIEAIDSISRPPEQATWGGYVDWAIRLRDEFLTPDAAWSAEDGEASQMVEEVVRSLAGAASVEPEVGVAVFLRALQDALRTRVRPEGRLGSGVVIGSHRLLGGLDFARVHILGVLDTGFPGRSPVDPLLAGDPLDRRGQREVHERHEWLAALAAADGGEVIVSAPTVDLEGRTAYPSPWLLELLSDGGTHPSATAVRLGAISHPRLRRVRTSDHSLESGTPLHVAEYRESEALTAHGAGHDLSRTGLAGRDDLALGGALRTARARRSAELTEFDGNVAAAAGLELLAGGLTRSVQSASGIQMWAACPFRFLLNRGLGVAGTTDVENQRWWQIDAAERGTLIHRILERFFAGVAASGRPAPGEPYDSGDLLRMEEIAGEEFVAARARGVVGHPLVWDNEQAAIVADLRTIMIKDFEDRAAGDWRPTFLEQPFGFEGDERSWPAVTVNLPDGRAVVLRGCIDRVDTGPNGARIIDYKSGRRRSGLDVTAANLLDGGRGLQLPLYAHAVRDHARSQGRPTPNTNALYWYCTTKGGFTPDAVSVDDEMESALTDVLGGIDAGVRAGCFPQVPGEYDDHWGRCQNCSYCDYDTLCPAGRDGIAAAKAGAADLEPYRSLQIQPAEQGV